MEVPIEVSAEAMEAHYAAIGKIAAAWAHFEHVIQWAIWGLAGMDSLKGPCVTTQIGNSARMIDAVIALLRENKAEEEYIKPLLKFAEEVGHLQRKRNRIIHDPWAFRLPFGEPFRDEMSANRRLVKELISHPTEELDDFHEKIKEITSQFEQLMTVPIPLPEILK